MTLYPGTWGAGPIPSRVVGDAVECVLGRAGERQGVFLYSVGDQPLLAVFSQRPDERVSVDTIRALSDAEV